MKTQATLEWVDEFIERIQTFVSVRLTDNVLIKMPNEVYQLNDTGARILSHLLSGGTVEQLIRQHRDPSRASNDLQSFLADIRQLLSSGFCDNYRSPTLKRTPFTLGQFSLPILSELAVTGRCNIRCQFCYASCRCSAEREPVTAEDELSAGEFKKILRIIRHDAEVPSVSFTGGEPTLRSDLIELVRYAHEDLGMRVNLITNGLLIEDEYAVRLAEAGLASAQVSIESPYAEIHDEIVGAKGAHSLSVKGLSALMNAGIYTHPHATLCSLNRESFHEMARFAADMGFTRFSANLVIPSGRGRSLELAVRYREVRELVESAMTHARSAGVRFMWYSPTPVCLFNPIAHGLGNKGCSACEGLLSIDSRGNLLPCSSWGEPVGNLLRDRFSTLWYGERARLLRRKEEAHPQCQTCEDFALCHGACPLYFREHGYDEIEPALARLRKEDAA